MELKWTLNKRKKLLNNNEIKFGVNVYDGKKHLRTIASAENPEGLAQLVFESGLRIDWKDKITTYSRPRIIPKNSYIEMPVSDDDIIRFYNKYWELVDGEMERK